MKMTLQGKITITILCIVVVLMAYFLFQPNETLKLKGKPTVTIQLNENYKDEGTNQKDAKLLGHVDTTHEGTYTLTYQYHKQEVQRTINVVDKSRLVMNLNGSADTYVKQNNPYIESGCHVIDKKDGNMSRLVKVSGKVDTTKVGDYQINYQISHNGLNINKTRTVHVVDEKQFDENKTGIPVLMYHYIYTKDDQPKKNNVNYLLDTKFEQQLQYLKEHHYYFPSYQELKAYAENRIALPKKSVILTFDDGQKGFLKYGIPLLEKYQIPATSFIIGMKNGEKIVKDYASEYISFQSHSYNMHRPGGNIGHGGIISALSEQEIIDDLKKSQEFVQNSESFAYPFGDYTSTALSAVKKLNILCSFTTHYGKVKKGDDCHQLPRIRVSGDNSLEGFIRSIE